MDTRNKKKKENEEEKKQIADDTAAAYADWKTDVNATYGSPEAAAAATPRVTNRWEKHSRSYKSP